MTKSINRFSTIAGWMYEPVLAASPVFAQVTRMSTGEERAITILRELHAAEEELVGRAVVMTDGRAGKIEHVYLDEVHVLRISIGGHERDPIALARRWKQNNANHSQLECNSHEDKHMPR